MSEPAPLWTLARRQDHVIIRTQALQAGLTRHAITHRTRDDGPWHPLLPGIYLMHPGQPTLAQLEIAAIFHGGPASALTGAATMRLFRFGYIPHQVTEGVDLLVPRNLNRSSTRAIRVPDHASAHVGGRIERAALRIACRSRRRCRGVVARPDRRTRAGCPRRAERPLPYRAARHGTRQYRQSRRCLLRQVIMEVTAGTRSAPEAELRDLFGKSRLPLPMFNPKLFLPDGTLGQYGIVTLHVTPHQLRTQPDAFLQRARNAYNTGITRPRLNIRAEPAG